MVARVCPVCTSNDDAAVFAEQNIQHEQLDNFAFSSRKTPEYMHYRLVRCPQCDCLYANPVPTEDEVQNAYTEAAFDSGQEAGFAARCYGRLLPAIVKKLKNRNGALDIGTGDGAFLEELLHYGFTGVTGVEPSKAPIRAAREKIRPLIRNGLFNTLDYTAGSLSLISCFQTLEHLYDPLTICRDVYSLVRPGGAFLSVFHNSHALSLKILGTSSPIFDIEHMQIFSCKSIRVLLARAGFTKCEVRPIFNTYPLHYWAKLLPLPKKSKAQCVAFLKESAMGNLPVPLPAGNMAVVAWKTGT